MRTPHPPPRASTLTASVALCGFVCFAIAPRAALADEQPMDPYAPAAPRGPVARPLDPYAPGVVQAPPGPTLPIAPPQPVPPPLPIAPPGADPYAAPPYGSYDQPPPSWAPPPQAPYGNYNYGGCSVPGCNTGASALPIYQPQAPNQQTERHPRYGLVAGGLAMFGGLWVTSLSTGVLAERYELAIPIAGPIMTATDINHQYGRSDGLRFLTTLLVVDALFQTAGIIMAIAGGASRVTTSKRRPYPYTAVQPYGAGIRF